MQSFITFICRNSIITNKMTDGKCVAQLTLYHHKSTNKKNLIYIAVS